MKAAHYADYQWVEVLDLVPQEPTRVRPRLRLPDWRIAHWDSDSFEAIRAQRRSEHRRKRQFCPIRRHWKSLAHIRGGPRFVTVSWWRYS